MRLSARFGRVLLLAVVLAFAMASSACDGSAGCWRRLRLSQQPLGFALERRLHRRPGQLLDERVAEAAARSHRSTTSGRIHARGRTPMSRQFVRVLMIVAVLMACTRSTAAQELFISEYIEGSSNNKAIEIYNPGASPVTLTGYSLQVFFNGSATATLTIPLSGVLAPGDVYVVAHTMANAAILAKADQTNGAGWFNGDDAVVLRNGTTAVDVVGQIGLDPGTEWGSGLASTADNTLRRKTGVLAGDPNGSRRLRSVGAVGRLRDRHDRLPRAVHLRTSAGHRADALRDPGSRRRLAARRRRRDDARQRRHCRRPARLLHPDSGRACAGGMRAGCLTWSLRVHEHGPDGHGGADRRCAWQRSGVLQPHRAHRTCRDGRAGIAWTAGSHRLRTDLAVADLCRRGAGTRALRRDAGARPERVDGRAQRRVRRLRAGGGAPASVPRARHRDAGPAQSAGVGRQSRDLRGQPESAGRPDRAVAAACRCRRKARSPSTSATTRSGRRRWA